MKLGAENNSGFEIITGVIDVNILAVNPTLEELVTIGGNLKKEPEYMSANPETGAKKIRLDFWIKPAAKELSKYITKHTFFLEDDYRVAKSGKLQFINAECKASYADSADLLPEWFSKAGVRQAKIGEAELMEFLKNFANVKDLEFDNFNALFNGNMTELRGLLAIKKDSTVQLLWGEKGGYQATYNRYSARGGNTRMDFWTKHLEKSSTEFNYQGTLKPKVWENQTPEVTKESDDSSYDVFK